MSRTWTSRNSLLLCTCAAPLAAGACDESGSAGSTGSTGSADAAGEARQADIAIQADSAGSPMADAGDQPDVAVSPMSDATPTQSRDGGLPPEPPGPDMGVVADLEPLRTALDRAVDAEEVPGFAFVLLDANGQPLLRHAGGRFTLESVVPYDSAIKPVTSLVVLTLVRDGLFGLDETVGEHLGWQGEAGTPTVAQLLSFTSGFPGDVRCTTPPPMLREDGMLQVPGDRTSLQACAETLRDGGLEFPSGTTFTYGATHQLVLAHLAETVTGEAWNTLFDTRVRAPLGLTDAEVRYANNRVAAGAVGQADAMARMFWALTRDAGVLGESPDGPVLLPRPLAASAVENRILSQGATFGGSPWQRIDAELHFGLGLWIDCEDLAAGRDCVYLGSGANGTTVWADPVSRTVAALVLYQGSFAGYVDGYGLYQTVKPLVRAAIGTSAEDP